MFHSILYIHDEYIVRKLFAECSCGSIKWGIFNPCEKQMPTGDQNDFLYLYNHAAAMPLA